jgi:hypothetical protein
MAKHAQNPRIRPVMSEEQRKKLSDAQKRYVTSDPRWEQHRAKLAAAQKKPEQRERLSVAMLAYIASDPRWPDHRVRLHAAALEVTKLTLFPEEIEKTIELRHKGRTFEYISEELTVGSKIIRRELKQLGIPTGRVGNERRAKRGKGFWRSFDPA